jgi:hypothetical protein
VVLVVVVVLMLVQGLKVVLAHHCKAMLVDQVLITPLSMLVAVAVVLVVLEEMEMVLMLLVDQVVMD